MKKFFVEFKKFISRGNVIDLAVGVIIGGAFTAIVTALTNGILKPFINWIISMVSGGQGVESIYTFLQPVYETDPTTGAQVLDMSKSIYIDWGAFISAIINFFLVALILFLIIRTINRAKELTNFNSVIEKKIERKSLANKKLNKREVAYLAKKEELERANKEAEEKAKEEANKLTRSEQLLTDIKTLLENKNK